MVLKPKPQEGTAVQCAACRFAFVKEQAPSKMLGPVKVYFCPRCKHGRHVAVRYGA